MNTGTILSQTPPPVEPVSIMVSVMLGLLKQGIARSVALEEVARQFKEFRELNEARLGQMAVLLGQSTDTPAYTWLNILRSAQKMQIINGNGNGNGKPPPPPKSDPAPLIIIAAVLMVLIVAARR